MALRKAVRKDNSVSVCVNSTTPVISPKELEEWFFITEISQNRRRKFNFI